jgi:hypothetical protein
MYEQIVVGIASRCVHVRVVIPVVHQAVLATNADPFRATSFSGIAAVTLVRPEDDGDPHLVVLREEDKREDFFLFTKSPLKLAFCLPSWTPQLTRC